MQTGGLSMELRRHAAECPDCSEALRLAEALREEARRAERRCNPPDPYWILQRSHRMAREIAMRRMTLLLASMRALAAFYVVMAAGWLLRGYAALQYREVASAISGASTEFALMGAMVAAVCVIAGLWPILREDAVHGKAGSMR
jgi:hypothetical protein